MNTLTIRRSSETQLLLDTEGLEAVYVSLLRLPNASTVVLPRLFAALLQTLTQIERFVQEEVKQEPGKHQGRFLVASQIIIYAQWFDARCIFIES